uniref:Uncharacterized protein n=1 Tax=Oryza sativa subsp. japonica TaxID=39947 RepID=Q6ZHC4_ORYSJ|nr:hypothetical protein [Oryza sativa Japonica Group]
MKYVMYLEEDRTSHCLAIAQPSIEGIKPSPFTMLSVLVIAHTAAHVAARDDIEVVAPGPAHLVLHCHALLLPAARLLAIRAKDLNEMFPVANAEVAPMLNPRGFANLLWKQLNHLGNTGFDLALFRVNAYSNMLYLHADSTSPLT